MSKLRLKTPSGGSVAFTASEDSPLDTVVLVPTGNSTMATSEQVVASMETLVASSGASLVGYMPVGTGAKTTTVEAKLRGSVSVLDFFANGDSGAAVDPTGVVDSTLGIQAAINTGKAVYIPKGAYLIDPRIGLVLKNGTTIYGDGKASSILVAMSYGGTSAELITHTKGSVIKRQFNPVAANNYVSYVHLSDFAVILNHPLNSITTTDLQIGIDLRHITRSVVENVWVGNINVTGQTVYTKTDPSSAYAAQGYGIMLGSVSSGDIAYCGGEVNIVRNCNAVGAYKGIVLDDGNISPQSASHSTTIERCDVQACHHLLVQESQYSAGVQFLDNTLQSVTKAFGNVSNSFVVRMEGYNGTVAGGYIEAGGSVDYLLYLGASSKNNDVTLPYYGSTSGAGNLSDAGTNNTLHLFKNTGIAPAVNSLGAPVTFFNNVEVIPFKERWVKFHWDGSAIVVDGSSSNMSVSRTGVGDYTVTYSPVLTSANYAISVLLDTNASGHGGLVSVGSHSSSNCRIYTYGQNAGVTTAIDPRFVWFRVGS